MRTPLFGFRLLYPWVPCHVPSTGLCSFAQHSEPPKVHSPGKIGRELDPARPKKQSLTICCFSLVVRKEWSNGKLW